MKKLTLIFLLSSILLSYVSHAQLRRRGGRGPVYTQHTTRAPYVKPVVSLSVGYGFPNLDKNQFLNFYEYYRGTPSQTGPVHAALDFQLNRSTGIGALVSYGKTEAPFYRYNAPAGTPPEFTGQLQNWSILLNLVRYLPVSPSVTPYVRTAFGVAIWDQNYLDAAGNKIVNAPPDPPAFTYQASMGIRLAFSKHTGLFAEAGYGKYIISGGLFVKLN